MAKEVDFARLEEEDENELGQVGVVLHRACACGVGHRLQSAAGAAHEISTSVTCCGPLRYRLQQQPLTVLTLADRFLCTISLALVLLGGGLLKAKNLRTPDGIPDGLAVLFGAGTLLAAVVVRFLDRLLFWVLDWTAEVCLGKTGRMIAFYGRSFSGPTGWVLLGFAFSFAWGTFLTPEAYAESVSGLEVLRGRIFSSILLASGLGVIANVAERSLRFNLRSSSTDSRLEAIVRKASAFRQLSHAAETVNRRLQSPLTLNSQSATPNALRSPLLSKETPSQKDDQDDEEEGIIRDTTIDSRNSQTTTPPPSTGTTIEYDGSGRPRAFWWMDPATGRVTKLARIADVRSMASSIFSALVGLPPTDEPSPKVRLLSEDDVATRAGVRREEVARIFGALEFRQVSEREFVTSAVQLFSAARSVGQAFQSIDSAASAVRVVVGIAWTVLAFLSTLVVFKVDISTVLVGMGTTLVSVSFAAADPLKFLVLSLYFVLFSRPFEVGDRVRIGDNVEGFVEKIEVLSTKFRDSDNLRFTLPNHDLVGKKIYNLREAVSPSVNVYLDVGAKTTAEQLDKLVGCILSWARMRNHLWRADKVEFYVDRVSLGGPQGPALSLNISIDHRLSMQQYSLIRTDASTLRVAILHFLQELNIEYVNNPTPVIVGDRELLAKSIPPSDKDTAVLHPIDERRETAIREINTDKVAASIADIRSGPVGHTWILKTPLAERDLIASWDARFLSSAPPGIAHTAIASTKQ